MNLRFQTGLCTKCTALGQRGKRWPQLLMLQIINSLQSTLKANLETTQTKWFTGHAHFPINIYKLNFEVSGHVGQIVCEERNTDFPTPNSKGNLTNIGFIFLWTISLARNTNVLNGSISINRNGWISQLLGNGPIKVESTNINLNNRKLEDFKLDSMISLVNIEAIEGILKTQTHLSKELTNSEEILRLLENLIELSNQIKK